MTEKNGCMTALTFKIMPRDFVHLRYRVEAILGSGSQPAPQLGTALTAAGRDPRAKAWLTGQRLRAELSKAKDRVP